MDYDSARHHLEAVQNAKKKDEAKIAKVKKEILIKNLPALCLPTMVAGGWTTLGLGNDEFNIQSPEGNPVSSDTDALQRARNSRLGRAWVWGRRAMVSSKPNP